MLRRSSVFAAEVMEVFDRSPTDKELVSQAKALCRDYIHSRLNRAGIGWSKSEQSPSASGGPQGEVSSVLLWLGKSKIKVNFSRVAYRPRFLGHLPFIYLCTYHPLQNVFPPSTLKVFKQKTK